MSDNKVILTAEQAEALLAPGERVHNFANPAGMLVGCDDDRDRAIAALKAAKQIELGGPACMAMKHPIVVWDSEKHCTFFEADMDKIAALESTHASQ